MQPIGLQNPANICYLNSAIQCFIAIDYSIYFLLANAESPLITILKEFAVNKEDVKDIRSLLISHERYSILSNAVKSTLQCEVQGMFHNNHQLDAYESLLKIVEILHNHFN